MIHLEENHSTISETWDAGNNTLSLDNLKILKLMKWANSIPES